METVTISTKYQIVIPIKARKALAIQPGQKVQVVVYDNRIELILVKPIQTARGFLRGIDTTVERELDRL